MRSGEDRCAHLETYVCGYTTVVYPEVLQTCERCDKCPPCFLSSSHTACDKLFHPLSKVCVCVSSSRLSWQSLSKVQFSYLSSGFFSPFLFDLRTQTDTKL